MSLSRLLRTAAVAAVLLAAGTACGAGSELRGAMASSSPAPAPPVVGPVTTASSTAPADPDAPAGPCAPSLAISIGPSTVSGGIASQDLIFQNTGTAPCRLRGFPSVTAVAGNEGTTVGDPALPVGERGPQIRLEPLAAATVPLRVRDAAGYDAGKCRPQAARGLRVFAPGGSAPVFVPREATVCAGTRLDPPQATVGTAVAR